MNRRQLFALVAGAALAPVAFVRAKRRAVSRIQYSTYTFWRNREPVYFRGERIVWDDERAEMEKLYQAMSRSPQPDLILVDPEILKLAKLYRPELFA